MTPGARWAGPILALLVTAQPAIVGSDDPTLGRDEALEALTPGSRIQVAFAGERTEGDLRESTRFGLVLAAGGSETRVEANAVEGPWSEA